MKNVKFNYIWISIPNVLLGYDKLPEKANETVIIYKIYCTF